MSSDKTGSGPKEDSNEYEFRPLTSKDRQNAMVGLESGVAGGRAAAAGGVASESIADRVRRDRRLATTRSGRS